MRCVSYVEIVNWETEVSLFMNRYNEIRYATQIVNGSITNHHKTSYIQHISMETMEWK